MEEAKNLPFQLNLLGEKTNCALYSGSLTAHFASPAMRVGEALEHNN
jgi:hypothetical protein